MCLLAIFFLVPFPMNVSGVGLVQVESGYQQSVVVPAPGGFLEVSREPVPGCL